MTLFIILVVLVVVVVAAALVIRSRNRQANIARADELRGHAASSAQATIAPAQERAAVAEERAEEAREVADRAEAEAEQARLEASRVEAEHESQVRAADRLDPRVDHRAGDYEPQVAGTVDQQPTPPGEANPGPTSEADGKPLLPRRTPGANDMPGKPIETTDGAGGWFTRKESDPDAGSGSS